MAEAVGGPLLPPSAKNLPSYEATTEEIRSKKARDRCLVTLRLEITSTDYTVLDLYSGLFRFLGQSVMSLFTQASLSLSLCHKQLKES